MQSPSVDTSLPLLSSDDCPAPTKPLGPGRLVALQPLPQAPDGPPPRLKKLNAVTATSMPEHLCHRYKMIPLLIDGNEVTVAIVDASNIIAIDDTRLISGLDVRPIEVDEEAIMRALGSGDAAALFDALEARGHSDLVERLYASAAAPAPPPTVRQRMDYTSHFPLQALEVAACISGPLCSVKVAQRFANPYPAAIEAVYIFPLPAGAAVHAFRMRVKNRVVESQLQEKKQARETYETGKRQGYRAALIEQDRDNVFTVTVGNLPPGEEVTIELEYAERLTSNEAETIFRFPLVVAPRYIPGEPLERGSQGDGTASDTDQVPDASRITPPLLLPELREGGRLNLSVRLDAAGQLPRRLACSQHAIAQASDDGALVVGLARDDEMLDRDFILRFRLAAAEPLALLLTTPAQPGHFLLSVLPPSESTADVAVPRDVVFLLDRSGSMGGPKMVSARRAVAHFLGTLNREDRFAVMAFDTSIEVFGETRSDQVPLHSISRLAEAQAWLNGIDARGGTEIRRPIERMLATPSTAGRMLCGVLITDGQVGNESAIYDLVSQHPSVRIFTLGVDTAVNDAFLRRVAEIGRGTCELVTPGEALEGALDRLARETGRPLVTDLQLVNRGLEPLEESVAPWPLPDLFAARPVHVSGKMSGGGGVELRGKIGVNGTWSTTVTPTVSPNAALGILWARERVRCMEDMMRLRPASAVELEKSILALALEYGLLTRYTSFVLVDRTEVVNPQAQAQTVVQPVPLPAGWQPQGFTEFSGFGAGDLAEVQETVKDISAVDFGMVMACDVPDDEIALDKLTELVDEAPIVRVANLIINQGMNDRATEIVIEPRVTDVMVSYCVDGVMHEVMSPPMHIMAPLIGRFKKMCGANPNLFGRPQSARMQITHEGNTYDIDFAFCPLSRFERITLRLRKRSAALGLDRIGLGALQPLLRKRGLILVVGGAGSGVSTTLHAVLHSLNQGGRTLMACDGSYVFDEAGIVEPRLSETMIDDMLGQRPDVLAVSSVTDPDSARALARAATERCLVLAGLAADDAGPGLTRWMQLVGSAPVATIPLLAVVAQRLVRLLCPLCRQVGAVSTEVLEPLHPRVAPSPPLRAGRGVGCDRCRMTGYLGVRALYSLWPVTDALRAALTSGSPLDPPTLWDDALRAVLAEETSVEECLRVLSDV